MKRSFAFILGLSLATGSLAPGYAADGDTRIGNLTVLATTDVHSHAVDYDYFTGQTFGAKDSAKALGMDHLSTAIKQLRTERGAESTLLLDNGDANQGTPLASYYQQHRIAETTDPMASVFNMLGYDAGVVGNHEFNYGLEASAQYVDDLNMPLLGANVIDVKTGQPAYKPYEMFTKTVNGEEVKVGVIGVVTPGVSTWDKATVSGNLEFKDAAATAAQWAPKVKAEGADVVIVLAHTGLDADGYVYNQADLTENVAKSVAEQSTDIDVVVGGHSHRTDKVQEYFTNKNGERVLFTQPGYWARFLSDIQIPLVKEADGDIEVLWSDDAQPTATAVNASDFAQDPAVLAAIEPYHSQTQQWVQTMVAQSTEQMSAATSAWEDTAIVDFINRVQTDELTRALKGTQYEGLPVLAEASPFSRTAVFNQGDVTIADMAGLYIYDNTLYGVEMTGAQIKDYLEYSARYYKQQEPGAEIADWSTVTNEIYPGDTRGIPDYSYDILSGVNYHINISKPVGQRIENLTLADGTELADDARVVLAVNNYRWSGGSGYPHVTNAPIVYEEQKAVRDLMIDWAIEHKTIDPADFFEQSWTVGTSAAVQEPVPSEPAPSEPVPSEPAPAPSEVEPSQPAPAPSEVAPGEDSSVVTPVPASAESEDPSVSVGDADSAAGQPQPVTVNQGGPAAVAREDAGSSAISRGALAHTGAHVAGVLIASALLLLIGGAALMVSLRKKA